MVRSAHECHEKARTFLYRNARPLDLARWQYHFEGGSKDAVLTALKCYQNKDGGFGHALEPDAWNPYSSPIQTWVAMEILRETDFTDSTHPIIQGILRYLESGQDFNGQFWFNTVKTNNDYPHAPWWHTGSTSTSHHNYNPTACLAGFILCFAQQDSRLYRLGKRIAGEAFDAYMNGELLDDMHTSKCFIRLKQYAQEAESKDVFDIAALQDKLLRQVHYNITQDTEQWETGYICKPSQFFNDRTSEYYQNNSEIAEYESAFILRTQLEDGSWAIPWGWADYPEAWALSKNWWKADIIIKNLLYLKGFGKL